MTPYFPPIPPYRRGTFQIFPFCVIQEVAVFAEDILEPVITVGGGYLHLHCLELVS